MPMTSKQMMKYLKERGFVKISQNGSHVKMRNPYSGKQTVVPYHKKDLPVGTESSILKQASLYQNWKKGA
ncbi:MAG: type II toxin-antitoxin system HicA family toxin [Turicibacter sp.]|nr:type II toxin-antitoxin system HicA family toxin [Turicibacter sp.]